MWPFDRTYSVTNSRGRKYYLHYKNVFLNGCSRPTTIFYFAKDKREGQMRDIPAGWKVFEGGKCQLPMLRRV